MFEGNVVSQLVISVQICSLGATKVCWKLEESNPRHQIVFYIYLTIFYFKLLVVAKERC